VTASVCGASSEGLTKTQLPAATRAHQGANNRWKDSSRGQR
jgi:hypothetical protein